MFWQLSWSMIRNRFDPPALPSMNDVLKEILEEQDLHVRDIIWKDEYHTGIVQGVDTSLKSTAIRYFGGCMLLHLNAYRIETLEPSSKSIFPGQKCHKMLLLT